MRCHVVLLVGRSTHHFNGLSIGNVTKGLTSRIRTSRRRGIAGSCDRVTYGHNARQIEKNGRTIGARHIVLVVFCLLQLGFFAQMANENEFRKISFASRAR